jgi:predicted histone-like DNA-binding protein
MGIKYKIMSTRQPGAGKDGKEISFPKLTGTQQMDLRNVARTLAERTTLSEADVYAVVVGLTDLIPEMLSQGYTIKLDRLGTFRLHARVTPSDHPDKVTVRNIKEFTLSFRPDNEVKKALQSTVATKQH